MGVLTARRAGGAMFGRVLGPVLACGVLLGAAPALAQSQCSREQLQTAVEEYIAVQSSGDPTKMHTTLWTDYTEQLQVAGMAMGLISKPQKIDFHRSVLDTRACRTFTEAVIAEGAEPRVLGVLLEARGGQISTIELTITDAGDWMFDAASTLTRLKAQSWSEIAEGERDTRETLIAAANAYLDAMEGKEAAPPFAGDCARLEGGLYSAASCTVDLPKVQTLKGRRHIVDETMGMVAVVPKYGADQQPEAHVFRIEKGRIRAVHTMRACEADNCGAPRPAQLQAAAD